MENYLKKYLKYKIKYLDLKQYGGKLPYIIYNDKPDFFAFDNEIELKNYNYYYDNFSLIIKDLNNGENYLLNEFYQFEKYNNINIEEINNKNIINNNNIYKLVDYNIEISNDLKIPFHLCMLQTKYKVLDYLYNTFEPQLNSEIKDLKYYTKQMFHKIFIFDNKNIINISSNYNILLKYSFCNKLLEFLKLIYEIQSSIIFIFDQETQKKQFDIKFEYDKSKAKENIIINCNFDLEEFIIYHIIKLFLNSNSELINNKDKLINNIRKFKTNSYNFDVGKGNNKSKIVYDEEFKNAVIKYINFSDITYLFELIKQTKDTKNVDMQNKNNLHELIIKKHKLDIDKDLKDFKYYINQDINDIKKLICFNIYVDNYIDQFEEKSLKISNLFYASFISYRINSPYLAYSSFTNYLYPINITNFISKLLELDTEMIKNKMNDNKLTNNQELFYSSYIKPFINSYDGYSYSFENYGYINCVENAIFQFIKILFWKNNKFIINLPSINKPHEQLINIINNLNSNLHNIANYYNSEKFKQEKHKLFSNQKNDLFKIIYIKPKDSITFFELDSTIDNFINMLCFLLGFNNLDEFKNYINNIKQYNNNIDKIIINEKIDEKTYKNSIISKNIKFDFNINEGHTSVREINDNNSLDYLLKYIDYSYFKLLLYYSNIFNNFSTDIFNNYFQYYNKNDKHYKEIAFYSIKNSTLDVFQKKSLNYILDDVIIEFLQDINNKDYELVAIKIIIFNYQLIKYIPEYKQNDIIIKAFLYENTQIEDIRNFKSKIFKHFSKYIEDFIFDENNFNNKDYDSITLYTLSNNFNYILKFNFDKQIYFAKKILLYKPSSFILNYTISFKILGDSSDEKYVDIVSNLIIYTKNYLFINRVIDKIEDIIINIFLNNIYIIHEYDFISFSSIYIKNYINNKDKSNNNNYNNFLKNIIVSYYLYFNEHYLIIPYLDNDNEVLVVYNILNEILNTILLEKRYEIITNLLLNKTEKYIKIFPSYLIIEILNSNIDNLTYINIASIILLNYDDSINYINKDKYKEVFINAIILNHRLIFKQYINKEFFNDLIINYLQNDNEDINYINIAKYALIHFNTSILNHINKDKYKEVFINTIIEFNYNTSIIFYKYNNLEIFNKFVIDYIQNDINDINYINIVTKAIFYFNFPILNYINKDKYKEVFINVILNNKDIIYGDIDMGKNFIYRESIEYNNVVDEYIKNDTEDENYNEILNILIVDNLRSEKSLNYINKIPKNKLNDIIINILIVNQDNYNIYSKYIDIIDFLNNNKKHKYYNEIAVKIILKDLNTWKMVNIKNIPEHKYKSIIFDLFNYGIDSSIINYFDDDIKNILKNNIKHENYYNFVKKVIQYNTEYFTFIPHNQIDQQKCKLLLMEVVLIDKSINKLLSYENLIIDTIRNPPGSDIPDSLKKYVDFIKYVVSNDRKYIEYIPDRSILGDVLDGILDEIK
jgi:hypothetical protein